MCLKPISLSQVKGNKRFWLFKTLKLSIYGRKKNERIKKKVVNRFESWNSLNAWKILQQKQKEISKIWRSSKTPFNDPFLFHRLKPLN